LHAPVPLLSASCPHTPNRQELVSTVRIKIRVIPQRPRSMRFSFPSPITSLFSVSSVRPRRRRLFLFVAPFASPRRSAKTKDTQRALAPSLERERESETLARESTRARDFFFGYYQGCLTGVFWRSGVVKKVVRNSTFVIEQALLVWGLLLLYMGSLEVQDSLEH
jgi:hypothetical protein